MYGLFGGGLAGESGYSAIDAMFIERVLINHPDDYEAMYLGHIPLLDLTSIALWERYTDEFTASSEAVAQFFTEWQAGEETRAETRAEYLSRAGAICGAAREKWFAAEAGLGLDQGFFGLGDIAAGYQALIPISEEALAEMRALSLRRRRSPACSSGSIRCSSRQSTLTVRLQRRHPPAKRRASR